MKYQLFDRQETRFQCQETRSYKQKVFRFLSSRFQKAGFSGRPEAIAAIAGTRSLYVPLAGDHKLQQQIFRFQQRVSLRFQKQESKNRIMQVSAAGDQKL